MSWTRSFTGHKVLIYGIIETSREKPVKDKLKKEILSQRMEYDLKQKLFNNPLNSDVTSRDLESWKVHLPKKRLDWKIWRKML